MIQMFVKYAIISFDQQLSFISHFLGDQIVF